MTSLAETYLSCKTAMANKLNAKGITDASADDGLTTLINYIDDIAPGVNGLLLSADKSIGQSSDTVNFTALYVSDGNVVSGKSVNFYGLKSATSTSKSLTANTWTPVGCKYSITVPSSGEGGLQLTKYNSSYQSVNVVWAAGIIVISGGGDTYNGVSDIVFEDGILSFTYNGNTVTKDISSFDCTEVNASVSGVTIDDYGVFDTTDANGVATAQYTCSGAGKFDVQAISGSVVSQPYPVIDATFYDEAILGHKNDVWYNQSNAWTIDPKSDGTEVSIAQSSIQSLFAKGGTSWSSASVFEPPFAVEFDILAVTGELSIYVLGDSFISHGFSQNATGHYKLIVTGSKVYKIKDGQNMQTPYDKTMTGLFQIGFRGTTADFKYKNFVVYPYTEE